MTGAAAVACLYLTEWLKLSQGYWAVISAVIVIQPDVDETLRASRGRLVGTVIGAAVGGVFIALFGAQVWSFGIAVPAVILICASLGLMESHKLACVSAAIVMTIGHPESSWIFAFHRFLEVSIGIAVALLVSALFWPLRTRELLRESIRQLGR